MWRTIPNNNEVRGPRMLPIVYWKERDFFVDVRLREFRNIFNPHERIDFESEEGVEMREELGLL